MASKIREFRHAVSVLKKQGLITGSTQSGQKIDARSALPGWKIKGKRLDTLVKKYDDVVSGKATAVKVPPKQLQQFRKTGFETANNRVLVPHTKTETARFRAGQVAITNKTGIERIQIPVEFHNLKQYLTDIKKNAKVINRMKRNNEYFGIRFYGGQRAHFYSDISSLMADLENYESITQAKGKAKQLEIYQNLEIIKLTQHAAERTEQELHERRKAMSKEYNRRHAKRVYRRMKRKGAGVMDEYRRRKAANEKARRDRMKATQPKKYQEYLKAGRKRGKKYQAKHKGKKK
jgi:hypothetical protein